MNYLILAAMIAFNGIPDNEKIRSQSMEYSDDPNHQPAIITTSKGTYRWMGDVYVKDVVGTNITCSALGSEASIKYTFNGSSIGPGSILNIGSTNAVLCSEFKPVVTQSNGVYWIRFEAVERALKNHDKK